MKDKADHLLEIKTIIRPASVWKSYIVDFWCETRDILKRYGCEIFIMVLYVYMCVYLLYRAYYAAVYISPDSANYLCEAEALLNGYGYNQAGPSGYSRWFSNWPIGYPFLIALTAFITKCDLYLSSKILSMVILALCFLLLYKRFKRSAWIYTLTFLNAGFLGEIYLYTWSENLFILTMLFFSITLAEIIEKDQPERRWFLYLGIGCVSSFLSRYIGLITLMISLSVTFFYMISYHFVKRHRSHMIRSKIKGFVIVDMTVSMICAGYFLLNKIMSGKISGVERTVFNEDPYDLLVGLCDALLAESYNVMRIQIPAVITELGSKEKIVFISVCIACMFFLLGRKVIQKMDYRVVFIFIGIFYYIVFIFIRFHSSMDPFGSRFFAPASILITIGVLGYIQWGLEWYQSRICIAASMILSVLVIATCRDIKKIDLSEAAYSRFEKAMEDSLRSVPEKSTVIAFEWDYRIKMIRPDIYHSLEIDRADTVDDLFERYKNSEYICIRVKDIKIIQDILNEEDPLYSFFDGLITQGMEDEQYVVISVEDRQKVGV